MTEQRRLAAIVSADVAGYSRLMGRDEGGTLAALKAIRQEVVDPAIAKHGGRIVKTTGDGLLLEFPSVVNAVRCSVEVQKAMADRTTRMAEDRRIAFRIGINLGDIIVEGDDIFGDGVNVAARLQEIATPGGICISGRVHEDVRDRLATAFDDGGTQTLKNIARPVQVWLWQRDTAVASPAPLPTALPLPDKPSIAVLPFQNLSGNPEQEYFADGMTEDILTALSRFQSLFVIARNSSFTYKGRSVDIKQIGLELGVRYVLEGSVRTSGGRIRVTAQLIEASTGAHIWAERYDRVIADLFDIQDEVTAQIVSAIDLEVRTVEGRRRDRPIGGIEVWAQYHRGLTPLLRFTRLDNRTARGLFEDLTRLHPDFAPAAAAHGFACTSDVVYRWTKDSAASLQTALAATRQAVRLDDKDAFCHVALGRALLVSGERDLALASVEHGVARNPNSALAQLFLGMVLIALDRHAEALPKIELALRLNPRDPGVWSFHLWRATCLGALGDYEGALEAARQAVRERTDISYTHLVLAYFASLAGREHEALTAVAAARAVQADLTLRLFREASGQLISVRAMDETVARLRALGMPE